MKTTNLNAVEKFFSKLLGLNPQALSYCETQTRKQYLNQAVALFFVSFLAIATGIELGVNFTNNVYLIIATGILVSVLVFAMDYFILSISNVNAIGVVSRLLFSFTITIISAVSLLLLINGRDIENDLIERDNTAIIQLDNDYNQQKVNRYSNLKKIIDARQEYYDKIVQPEALNVYAGEKYTMKNKKFIDDGIIIERERAKLDSIEVAFHTQYVEQRQKLLDKNKPGIFEKIELLIKIVKASTVKIIFAVLIFIFLIGLEISALLAKFSLSNKNDYIDEWLPKIIASEKLAYERQLHLDTRERTSSVENKHLTLQRQDNTRALLESSEDFLYESTKLNALKALSLKHGNQESAKMAEQGLKTLIDLYTVNQQVNPVVNVSVDINDIFRMTEPMQSIVKTIMDEQGDNQLAIAEAIFTWMQNNIKYDDNHSKEYYKTASETYNFRHGICGEQSVLYMSFLKFAGISAEYVHVSVDDKSDTVNHACVELTIEDEKFLSDTSYHQFKIGHVEYEVLTDAQLAENYKSWNK